MVNSMSLPGRVQTMLDHPKEDQEVVSNPPKNRRNKEKPGKIAKFQWFILVDPSRFILCFS